MPAIKHKELKRYLNDLGNEAFAPVYLLYGEELLYKKALDGLLDALVPVSNRNFNYEPVDGINEDIHAVIQKINTFSLLPGPKVVALCDSRIFYSKQDATDLIKKSKQAHDNNDLKKAAKYLVSILAFLNLSFDDVDKKNRKNMLKFDSDSLRDDAWLDKVLDYCKENKLLIPAVEDSGKVLERAIEKGFPAENHLIITTDMVDKRRTLFKAIDKCGIIIDCSVPKGGRMADKKAREAFFKEMMRTTLAKRNKTMNQNAYSAMCEISGFDLRIFSNNLEKLVSYVGNRENITSRDVAYILKRTKKDPIYEFTNAVTDRNIENALFYMDSLLSGGDIDHPLVLLAAIVNQIRRLLLIKDFVQNQQGGAWHSGMAYNNFISQVMPAIQKYDSVFLSRLNTLESIFSTNMDTPGKKQKKKEKSSFNGFINCPEPEKSLSCLSNV